MAPRKKSKKHLAAEREERRLRGVANVEWAREHFGKPITKSELGGDR